jgi:C_GCAxxG_C_C family probable redox protein
VGEVCGAVSGGVLAIGLKYGEDQPEAAKHLSEEFVVRFEEANGAVRCRDILGFDMNSMEEGNADLSSLKGMLSFGFRGGKNVCDGVVSSAVEELLDMLEDWES